MHALNFQSIKCDWAVFTFKNKQFSSFSIAERIYVSFSYLPVKYNSYGFS